MKKKLKQPKISGIYGIYSKRKNLWYIGKSSDIFNRWESQHKRDLKRGLHHSNKLQHHYNKYGIEDLGLAILMETKDNLFFWEEFFIECFDSFENGFNCTPGGEDPPVHLRPLQVTNIYTGEVRKANSIKEFCQETGIYAASSISSLLCGRSKTSNGWALTSNHQKTLMKFVDPDGKLLEVFGYTEASRLTNLPGPAFQKLWKGEIEQYLGWRKFRSEADCVPYDFPKFISPSGDVFDLKGELIKDFAARHNLDTNCMCRVYQGSNKNHRGWRKFVNGKTPEPYKFKEYRFIDPDGKLVITNSMTRLAKDHGLIDASLGKVFKGVYQQHKGWKRAD